MKRCVIYYLVGVLLVLVQAGCHSSTSTQSAAQLYDASIDGSVQLDEALANAREAGKNLLVQVGGDWCTWCLKITQFIQDDPELDSIVQQNYIWAHLYYGKDNHNETAMARLGNPIGHGFPFFVVVSPEGVVLHQQETSSLESGETYNREALKQFLQAWQDAGPAPAEGEEFEQQSPADSLAEATE